MSMSREESSSRHPRRVARLRALLCKVQSSTMLVTSLVDYIAHNQIEHPREDIAETISRRTRVSVDMEN